MLIVVTQRLFKGNKQTRIKEVSFQNTFFLGGGSLNGFVLKEVEEHAITLIDTK